MSLKFFALNFMHDTRGAIIDDTWLRHLTRRGHVVPVCDLDKKYKDISERCRDDVVNKVRKQGHYTAH